MNTHIFDLIKYDLNGHWIKVTKCHFCVLMDNVYVNKLRNTLIKRDVTNRDALTPPKNFLQVWTHIVIS